ncbi:MAG: efflux RND transporter periplasmic adaptor subunit [Rhodospirillales bacterium]
MSQSVEEQVLPQGPSRVRRLAVGGAKLSVGLLLIGAMVGGIGLLHLRAQVQDEGAAVPPLPVSVAAVELSPGYRYQQRFAGRLEARRSTTLAFERGGLLTEVLVEEGDSLSEGQLVARLDVEPLQARRAELQAQRAAVVARLELARITTKRQQTLVRQGNASKQRFDEARLEAVALEAEVGSLEAAIRQLDIDIEKSSLIAPYAGRVAARDSDEGAILAAGSPVVELVETGNIEARIGLSPGAAATLEIGRRYPLLIGEETVEGQLLALRPDMATGTRTVSALFTLIEPAEVFLGELVVLKIGRDVAQPGFWLPLTALVAAPKGLWTAYTVEESEAGDARVAQEAVWVHHQSGEAVYVSGSLKPGALIVIAGPHRIVPGQTVDPLPTTLPSPPDTQSDGAGGTTDSGAAGDFVWMTESGEILPIRGGTN